MRLLNAGYQRMDPQANPVQIAQWNGEPCACAVDTQAIVNLTVGGIPQQRLNGPAGVIDRSGGVNIVSVIAFKVSYGLAGALRSVFLDPAISHLDLPVCDHVQVSGYGFLQNYYAHDPFEWRAAISDRGASAIPTNPPPCLSVSCFSDAVATIDPLPSWFAPEGFQSASISLAVDPIVRGTGSFVSVSSSAAGDQGAYIDDSGVGDVFPKPLAYAEPYLRFSLAEADAGGIARFWQSL